MLSVGFNDSFNEERFISFDVLPQIDAGKSTSINLQTRNNFAVKSLTNRVAFNFYAFSSLMVDWIRSNLNGAGVVRMIWRHNPASFTVKRSGHHQETYNIQS